MKTSEIWLSMFNAAMATTSDTDYNDYGVAIKANPEDRANEAAELADAGLKEFEIRGFEKEDDYNYNRGGSCTEPTIVTIGSLDKQAAIEAFNAKSKYVKFEYDNRFIVIRDDVSGVFNRAVDIAFREGYTKFGIIDDKKQLAIFYKTDVESFYLQLAYGTDDLARLAIDEFHEAKELWSRYENA